MVVANNGMLLLPFGFAGWVAFWLWWCSVKARDGPSRSTSKLLPRSALLTSPFHYLPQLPVSTFSILCWAALSAPAHICHPRQRRWRPFVDLCRGIYAAIPRRLRPPRRSPQGPRQPRAGPQQLEMGSELLVVSLANTVNRRRVVLFASSSAPQRALEHILHRPS